MGCMNSTESLASEAEEESEPDPVAPKKQKRDAEIYKESAVEGDTKSSCKRCPQLQGLHHTWTAGKKNNKPKSNNSTEQKSNELKPPSERSESMKIHVIWRRVSIFGSRRDSSRSCKSVVEAELPGPSKNSTLAPPEMSFDT